MTTTGLHNQHRNRFGDFKTIAPFSVGFEDAMNNLMGMFDETMNQTPAKYPPYNIVKFDETNYSIEIAVAGFSKEEIEIEYKDGTLTVTGKETLPDNIEEYTRPEYIHKGIAMRDFTHTFKLAADVEVTDAEICDGILSISLLKHIPEHQKAKKITISSGSFDSGREELLNE